jgi:hypothetical protein
MMKMGEGVGVAVGGGGGVAGALGSLQSKMNVRRYDAGGGSRWLKAMIVPEDQDRG